jgi:hypothetical protein
MAPQIGRQGQSASTSEGSSLKGIWPGQSSAHSSRLPPSTHEALERLGQIKQRFEKLIQGNWAPGEAEKAFDIAIMPTLVAAENARKPGLTLLETATDFRHWLRKFCPSDGKRAILPLPGYEKHVVVADVRRVAGETSVLLIDSSTPNDYPSDNYQQNILPGLRACLPPRTALMVIALDTQKALMGCRIFSLTAASKLADQKSKIDEIHLQNLSGESLKTGLDDDARQVVQQDHVRVFDGAGILPAGFYKHSQSATTLNAWAAAIPPHESGAPVNSKKQTLHERYQAHATERYASPYSVRSLSDQGLLEKVFTPDILEQISKPKHTSNSIEHKRLALLDRAMDHLRHAPESESRKLLTRLQAASISADNILTLDLASQDLGPHPSTL